MSKMILARILALVVGYFFGTFQTGYFYGKAHGIDVREHGKFVTFLNFETFYYKRN